MIYNFAVRSPVQSRLAVNPGRRREARLSPQALSEGKSFTAGSVGAATCQGQVSAAQKPRWTQPAGKLTIVPQT